MDVVHLLATALGLAALAGINLYLTVFLTGMAVRFQWIELAPGLEPLDALGHPAVLAVAGFMALAEMIADKSPWFDSLWDAVHTVIRPVGAVFIGLAVLGDMHPALTVIGVLLCGGVALTTHTAKAGFRLLVNASPEPFSNAVVSTAEDVGVVGGIFLVLLFPVLAIVLLLLFLGLFGWKAPKLFRFFRATGWLIIAKLRALDPGGPDRLNELPTGVCAAARHAFEKGSAEGEKLAWAVPAVLVSAGRLPEFAHGYVIETNGGPGGARRGALSGHGVQFLEDGDLDCELIQRALFDELRITPAKSGIKLTVRFAKHHRLYPLELVKRWEKQSGLAPVPARI